MATGFEQPDTEAEQEEVERFMRRGAQVELEPIDRFPADATARAAVDEPATVRLPIGAQELIRRLSDETVAASVVLDIAAPEAATTTALLVFANQPEPSVDGATEDPGYLGGIAFFCHGEQQDGQILRCELPAADSFRYRLAVPSRIADTGADGELAITFIATDVAPDGRAVPAVEIRATTLELYRSTVTEEG